MPTELTQEESDRCVRALKYYACRIENTAEANKCDDLANKLRGFNIGPYGPGLKGFPLGIAMATLRSENFQVQAEAIERVENSRFMDRMTRVQ